MARAEKDHNDNYQIFNKNDLKLGYIDTDEKTFVPEGTILTKIDIQLIYELLERLIDKSSSQEIHDPRINYGDGYGK